MRRPGGRGFMTMLAFQGEKRCNYPFGVINVLDDDDVSYGVLIIPSWPSDSCKSLISDQHTLSLAAEDTAAFH